MSSFGIRHLNFMPGQRKVWYRDLPGIDARIATLNIPDDETLWGWGYCRQAEGDMAEALRAATCSLGEGVPIDSVIACTPAEGDGTGFKAAIERTARDLRCDSVRWIEHGDCVNVLQALDVSRTLLANGARNVAVLAGETMVDEERRFRKYGLFSDFCLLLLISADPDGCPYEVLDVVVRPDPRPRGNTSAILNRSLETECVLDLLARAGLSRADVSYFLYLNLYLPIAEMKAREIGFDSRQLYMRLGSELAHCYGADPIVNLEGLARQQAPDGPLVLCASGPAYASAALVRIRKPHSPRGGSITA